MRQDDSSGSATLSLLDVMTCGMAGVLLLFLTVIGLRAELNLSDSDARGDSGVSSAPFLLLILSDDGDLFDGSRGFLAGEDAGLSFEAGRDHAIFFGRETPDELAEVWLANVADEAFVRVQLVEEGVRIGALAIELADLPSGLTRAEPEGEKSLQIWPGLAEFVSEAPRR